MISIILLVSQALYAEQAAEDLTKVVVTQAQGYSRLLAPVDPKKKLIGTRALAEGKLVQVVDVKPGVEIPSGSVIQTFDGKVKMALPTGDSFVASKSSELELKMDKAKKGVTNLDLKLNKGVVRGVVQKNKDLAVNLVTDQFKAKIGEAEFITAKLKNTDPKQAGQAAVMKMVNGSAQLKPLKGFHKQLIDAKAGADVVMGLKSAELVPMLKEKAMLEATNLDPKKLLKVPPQLEESLELINNTSAALESRLDAMIEPEDDCGCPTLEERLKRRALKAAKGYIAKDKKGEGGALTEANVAQTGAEEDAANPDHQPEEEKEETAMSMAEDLACMSPVLEDLQGAAQIVNVLKDGIFSSKEAKEGSCVKKNSLYRNFLNSRSKLKFPNGDELLSGDSTQMQLDWAKDQLNIKLDQGNMRGVFDKSADRLVNLKTEGLNATTNGGDLALQAKNKAQNLASSASAAAGTAASAASGIGGLLSGVAGVAGGVAGAAGAAQAQANAAAASAAAGAASGVGAAAAGAVAQGGAAAAAGAASGAVAQGGAAAAGAAAGAGGAAAGALGAAGSQAGAVLSVFDGAAKVGNQVVNAGSQVAAQAAKPVKIPPKEIQQVKAKTEPLKNQKIARTPARTGATHPSPGLEALELDNRAPEEALIRRYLDPSSN